DLRLRADQPRRPGLRRSRRPPAARGRGSDLRGDAQHGLKLPRGAGAGCAALAALAAWPRCTSRTRRAALADLSALGRAGCSPRLPLRLTLRSSPQRPHLNGRACRSRRHNGGAPRPPCLHSGLGAPPLFRLAPQSSAVVSGLRRCFGSGGSAPQEASSLHLGEQARLRSLAVGPSSAGPSPRVPGRRPRPLATDRTRPPATDEPRGLRPPQESPPAVPEVPALTSPRRYFFAASTGAAASTSPRSASSCRVRTAMECAWILKWRLAAARVSEKPEPSAPRVANSWFRKGRMRSGWVESKSLVATIGPACPPRRCLTYGVRGSAPTSVSLAASQSRASRRSSAHEVTDHTAASTPQSAASSSRASTAQGTATPEASSCACGREPGA